MTIYMIHRPKPTDDAYEGVSPELLEKCLTYANSAGYEFASIDEVITDALSGKKRKRPTLCFTLDDGYKDQLEQLVPVLLKHNCKPTLFAIVDMIDGTNWPWDSILSFAIWNTGKSKLNFMFENAEFNLDLSQPYSRRAARRTLTHFGKKLSSDALVNYMQLLLTLLDFSPTQEAPAAYRPITWSALRDAEKAGLRVGSHACSHRVFSALTDAQILDELQRAHERLKCELVSPSQTFCYPSGTLSDFSPHHTELIQKTGFFIGAVTSISGNTTHQNIRKSPFLIRRHSFPSSFEKFVRYSSWLEYIRSNI
ncbi:MAG: polysaccharide deacetylase family protein [Cellvibrio sp.]|uniref:polysaccharide deacetylase family protein n=1 Tax=Cellvibrio sp. TaxID=1965322 RepID=UPI0031AF7374